jgi:glycosyltransferase involved in cell wall biosynthesis
MKLVIQIPCWNEEATIAEAVGALPRSLPGVDAIEVLVVDDGSTDRSVALAQAAGASVVRLGSHRGLAAAFSAGIEEAVRRDADILVNTDADLQYPAAHIADIIAPIVRGEADIAIGDRLRSARNHFSAFKSVLQRTGSFCLRMLSGVPVRDAASGFRAFSREAFESMYIRGRFSYTLESLILAGIRGLRVCNVPISTNPPRRRSRLFTSIPSYLVLSTAAVLRAYLMYHPLRFFAGIGACFLAAAGLLGGRFLVYYLQGEGTGHLQSLVLLAVFALMGFQCVVLGLIGDVVSANRRLLEQLRIATLRRSKPST